MAKRNEDVFGIVEARLVKQDCEQALKKIDEGIKWSGYAFLSLFAMYLTMPIVFFLIIKHSLKKDLKLANTYIAMYEAEAVKMAE